jgi:hypothetical protein
MRQLYAFGDFAHTIFPPLCAAIEYAVIQSILQHVGKTNHKNIAVFVEELWRLFQHGLNSFGVSLKCRISGDDDLYILIDKLMNCDLAGRRRIFAKRRKIPLLISCMQ